MWVNFFDHFNTSTGVSWSTFYSVQDTLQLNAGEASADQAQHPIPDDSFGDFWYVRPALTDPTITVIARDDWTSYETVCITNPQWDGITPPVFPIIGALFRVRIRNVNRNGGSEVPLTLFAGPAFPMAGVGPPPFLVALDGQNIAVFDSIPGGDPDYVSEWVELPVVPPNPPSAPSADWSWLAVIPSGDSVAEFTYEVEWQIWVDDPPPPAVTCEELGRVTRAYVSAHTRTRVHDSRLFAREKRCLVANFNGAIPVNRSIASVVWDMDPVYAVSMSDAAISGREAMVMVTACWPGCAALRCEITLDNGEVYNQLFRVAVQDGPYFGDSNTAAGPARLTASA